MKLGIDVNEVTLSGAGVTGEFGIRNSPKAFKILSDGLYSNKIKAVIRELSCNALDSHVAAGKPDVKFEVHLPTIMEPWFSVKDFGLGLTGDQVENIYTIYFESTKTDSNDFIGALGLGSKSPFSYTENFTVTAIKNGTKRIYSAFIGSTGVPSIAEMSTELTDEENGVEVKFSVTNRYDYDSFRHEANEVFKWFKNPPVITGARLTVEPVKYRETNIIPGVHYLDSYGFGRHGSIALMGNIAYPLSKISEPEKRFGNLAGLLECGLVLEFNIGELDFAASREELSYIPLTIDSIKKKLSELNNALAGHLASKANAITNKWERASYLYEQFQAKLYRSAVSKYVADTKFELFDDTSHYGKFSFEIDNKELEDRGLSITAFRTQTRVHHTSKITVFHNRYNKAGTMESYAEIPVDSGAIFVLNDLKTGCQARAKFHYASWPKSSIVYCVTSSKAIEEREEDYDWLMEKIHTPPTVVKASSLNKPAKQRALSSNGIMELRKKSGSWGDYGSHYSWNPYTEEIDEDVTYYYVALSGFETIAKDGTASTFDIKDLKAILNNTGLPGLKDIKIFGVRKNKIKEIQDLDNWVWIEDKIRKEIAKVTDKTIVSLVATDILDRYYSRVYTNKNVAKCLADGSYYKTFMDNFGGIPRASGSVDSLVHLCTTYGKSVQVDKVKKEMEEAKEKLEKIYPLLKHLGNADEKDVTEYIKLIDKQEKT